MNNKPSEISTLTAAELFAELYQTEAMLIAAPSLPAFGHAPDPAILAAITARNAALKAELDLRVMP